MPRRTFFIGLAPAIALYEAAFIGLGAWLGRSAWGTVEHSASKPGILLAVIAVVGLTFIVRAAIKHARSLPSRAGTPIVASLNSSSSTST